MNPQPRHFVLAFTGASGAVYGLGVLRRLLAAGHRVDLIVSEAGRQVLAHEAQIDYQPDRAAACFASRIPSDDLQRLHAYDDDDYFSPPASGSSRWEAMIVCPCSMGSIGRFAGGVGRGLIERAVEVALKERRTLVLAPRETPYSVIGLENLTRLARAGAVIAPASPGFYRRPEKIEDLVEFMVERVLSLLGLEEFQPSEWGVASK